MNFKVAIIGAGQMASILAHRIPGSIRKVIIGRRKADAVALADEVGGVATDQVSAVRGCRVILLAVPGTAVPQVLTDMQPHLDARALVVNMATDLMTDELALEGDRRVASAKVIGHAREIELGSPGLVVLDRVEEAEADLLVSLLEGIGPVIRGDERTVMAANTAIIEVMVRAEAELRRRLEEVGLAAELVPVAIGSAAPGVLRAVAKGELGPFAREVVRRMGAGETAASRVSH
ncbi:MAG: pyrroline-5-carboxylate reductase family protein [Bacillota bacterium]